MCLSSSWGLPNFLGQRGNGQIAVASNFFFGSFSLRAGKEATVGDASPNAGRHDCGERAEVLEENWLSGYG